MKHLIFGLFLSAGLAASSVAFAAGEATPKPAVNPPAANSNSGGGTKDAVESPKKLKCKRNEVIKLVSKDGKKIKACVKVTAGIVPDEDLYQQGRLLAKAGEYDWALTLLTAIKNQDDPRVLNYTGYSHRKAGRLDTGITFYRKALSINPNFVLAREYLGEGYVAAGRIDLAKVELSEISKRCGVGCEEYKDLKRVIETAVN
jgi:tetratricopeptide (TPR) repeat protein